MADEFAQLVKGAVIDTDTILSTDGLAPVAVKKGTTWVPLEVDATSGGLKVDIVDATGLSIDVVLDPAESGVTIYGSDDGGTTQTVVLTDATGAIVVTGTVVVTATDLDIRNLTPTTDEVGIGDGTNSLSVNADGSINVNASGASDSIYEAGSATLVKDAATEVVSRAAAADEPFKGVMVSGAGLCQWAVKFGTTGAEATILEFWTTPSNPTQFVDLPDSLIVSSGETLLIEATNREKAASTASDFTGFASLIRAV